MVVLITFLIASLKAATRTIPARVELFNSPTCVGCTYELRGLSPGAACPECGKEEPSAGERRWRARTTIDLRIAGFCMVWVCLLSEVCVRAYVLAAPLLALSYYVAGYSWSTSLKAATVRDLSDPNPDPIGGTESMRAIMPLLIALALTPLCWRLPTLRAGVLRAMALVCGGVIMTLARWTIPYVLQ